FRSQQILGASARSRLWYLTGTLKAIRWSFSNFSIKGSICSSSQSSSLQAGCRSVRSGLSETKSSSHNPNVHLVNVQRRVTFRTSNFDGSSSSTREKLSASTRHPSKVSLFISQVLPVLSVSSTSRSPLNIG